ncbi:MAG: phosphomannomutase/phosphoglucomutase [Ghiorsea sp.]
MVNSFPSHTFREYDIRGLADSEITPVFAKLLAQAYITFLPQNNKQPIVVARDVRLSGKVLLDSITQALLEAGWDVWDIGVMPTPMAYYTVFQKQAAGCLVVTASHNPGEYNGFKMMVGKDSFHGENLQKLKALMINPLPIEACERGVYQAIDIMPEYHTFVTKDCALEHPLKVVIDAGNGPAGIVAAPLYRMLGCEVVELYCEPDGTFPNHHPDPTVAENLQDLSALVLESHADLGIAFDGDGDRIGVVDEHGSIIDGDMLLLLLSRQLLNQKPGATIISEVKSSQVLYDDIHAHGGKAIMWRTGHSPIKAKMRETGALLAGEMSGHFFFADRYFGFDDATYAGARVMQLLVAQNLPLSQLLKDVPLRTCTPEIRIACDDERKFKIVEEAKAFFEKQDCDMIDIDGVRLVFDKGWALLRASNTQPALVMRFEAVDAQALEDLQDRLQLWLSPHLISS